MYVMILLLLANNGQQYSLQHEYRTLRECQLEAKHWQQDKKLKSDFRRVEAHCGRK